MNAREHLPLRRESESFEQGGVHVMISRYADGRLGEIFLEAGRIGSDLWTLGHDAAVAVSIGLQYGVPLAVFQHALLKLRNGKSASVLGRSLDVIATP